MISERTRAALAAKRARGETWGGRKKGDRFVLTPVRLKAIQGMLDQGMKKTEMG